MFTIANSLHSFLSIQVSISNWGRFLNVALASLMHSKVFTEKQPPISDGRVGVGTEVLREVVDRKKSGA